MSVCVREREIERKRKRERKREKETKRVRVETERDGDRERDRDRDRDLERFPEAAHTNSQPPRCTLHVNVCERERLGLACRVSGAGVAGGG